MLRLLQYLFRAYRQQIAICEENLSAFGGRFFKYLLSYFEFTWRLDGKFKPTPARNSCSDLSQLTYTPFFCFPALVQSYIECCISNHNPAVITAVICIIFDDSDRCPKIALDPCQPFQLHYTIN